MKRPPRFVADAMLGSLARKLRIFGFDTAYFAEGGDLELEALARRERRVILTSDKAPVRALGRKRAPGHPGRGKDRQGQAALRPTTGGTGDDAAPRRGTGEQVRGLQRGARGSSEGRRRPRAGYLRKVLARHRLFYRCRSCSRFYWRGRHWERLRRLSYSLKTKDLT